MLFSLQNFVNFFSLRISQELLIHCLRLWKATHHAKSLSLGPDNNLMSMLCSLWWRMSLKRTTKPFLKLRAITVTLSLSHQVCTCCGYWILWHFVKVCLQCFQCFYAVWSDVSVTFQKKSLLSWFLQISPNNAFKKLNIDCNSVLNGLKRKPLLVNLLPFSSFHFIEKLTVQTYFACSKQSISLSVLKYKNIHEKKREHHSKATHALRL